MLILMMSFVAIFMGSPFSYGQITNPIKDLSDLYKSRTLPNPPKTEFNESAVRVKTAKIVLADYDLIKKDFPETRNMDNDEIDEWLLSNVGYITPQQAEQRIVNTKISVDKNVKVNVYRPYRYKRALVFKAGQGLIDAKGTGALEPTQGSHSNGLATLGEVVREFIFQRIIQAALDHAGQGDKTIGCYAVIDWGFDVIEQDGTISRAGAILRQAHRRNTNHVMAVGKMLRVEKILRRYGITSTGAERDLHFGRDGKPDYRINMQGSKEGGLVDFGGYRVEKTFTTRAFAKSFIARDDDYDHLGGYQDTLRINPNDSDWVQPDANLAVNFDTLVDDLSVASDGDYLYWRAQRLGNSTEVIREEALKLYDEVVVKFERQLRQNHSYPCLDLLI